MTRKRSTVAQLRRAMRDGSIALGTVRAAQTGRVPQRAANIVIGRTGGRILRMFWQ